MREAIARAEVGDEQKQEDPTVRRLERMVAELLGQEEGLYLPSGTMANILGMKLHTRPGDEVVMHAASHTAHYEVGGPAVHSGATVYPLAGTHGRFTGDQLEGAIRPRSWHFARTRLVWIEQTHNLAGGCVWPLDQLQDVLQVAKSHGLATHLDGARLLNASVATGIPARRYAEVFDTAWLDMSKGLGAPVGAVLTGSLELMREARRLKHMFGGAMRQAGIIAAAGVYALEHHVERLAEDHANARFLADGIAAIPGVKLDPSPETNIVFFDVRGTGRTAPELVDGLLGRGVRMGAYGRTRIRAVTHLDVNRGGIIRALEALRQVLGE